VTRDSRSPSAARIAATLGGAVAVVMLAIWGATAVAGIYQRTPALPAASRSLAGSSTPVAASAPSTATAPAVATPAVAAAPVVTPQKPKPAAKPKAKAKAKPKAKPAATSTARYIVVIDPGHGGDLPGSEPIGPWPGAKMVNKTNSGAEGEAAIALSVALKLRPLLEARGVKIVMTRTGPRAISNKSRAMIANAAHADLFLRLHCDGVGSSSVHGISMQIPGDSRGWAPIARSRKAGEIIMAKLLAATGAADRGIASRSGDNGLVGFNWSKVPTVVPEMGFTSNPAEYARLRSASYQNTLAKALCDGTMAYLHTVR
jgi:N-acetylmuramoyl-L-alanine amidase